MGGISSPPVLPIQMPALLLDYSYGVCSTCIAQELDRCI